jgi:hypothetical protein
MHRSFGAAIGLDAYVEALEGRERPLSGRLRCRWAAQALSSAAGLLRFAAHFVAGDRLPGDPAVARADQLWGRLRELLRRRSEYDRWLRDVRGAAWRRPIR